MPWNGHTFYLNFFQPFQNYWEHLLDDPATDGDIAGTGIQIPTLDEFGRSLQSVDRVADRGLQPLRRW